MSDPIHRVAVTGAAGYVGSGLIERLAHDKAIERILALDIRPPNKPYTSKVVFHRHDVTAPMAEVLSEHQIDAVVHLAFILHPSHNHGPVERVNVGGTANVLDACARVGVQYLQYLSSTTVYGAHPDNPPLLSEESPIRPVKGFQYGENKAQAEALIREHSERDPVLKATVLRVCPVMGPNADNFVSRAFSKPFLVGIRGSDPALQLLHEDDLIEVMHRCLMERVSGVYNLAGDGPVRWSEMASMFGRRLISLPAPLLYGLTGVTWALHLQGDSPPCGLDFIRHRWTVSTDKIRGDLGISLRHSSKNAWEDFVHRQQEREPAPVDTTPGP